MGVSAAGPHLRRHPDRFHQFFAGCSMPERCLRMAPDAVGALRYMRNRDGNQLLGLRRQRTIGENLLAERLEGLLRLGGKRPAFLGKFVGGGWIKSGHWDTHLSCTMPKGACPQMLNVVARPRTATPVRSLPAIREYGRRLLCRETWRNWAGNESRRAAMSRTHRLFDLLQTLRRHRQPVSGAALAREAGVSLRTLYRDIAALQAIGAEIEGEPGLGYVLKPGFLLPPLMLSAAEIEALALGAQWVARRTDEGLSHAARNAMAKIAAVLPPAMRQKLEDDALIVGQGWERGQAVALSVLRQALHEERKLAIAYCDEKGARTARVVWPAALGFFESTRILAAWCELRGGFRHFRADRIETAELLPRRLPKSRKALAKEWRRTLLTESGSSERYKRASQTHQEPDMSKELILYTNPRSRGGIVHWMLEEIGCPYRVEVKEYGTTMKAPDYLAINPMGKVPAIKHGDTVVTETPAILAYLADAFPEAGLAPAPAERGEYYRWLFFGAGCMEPAWTNHSVGWDPSTPELQGRFGYGSFALVMETLAGALKGKTYIAGDRFSAADIYVGSMLNYGMMFGAIEKRPEFEAYCAGLLKRPAGVRAREKAEKLANQQAWPAA